MSNANDARTEAPSDELWQAQGTDDVLGDRPGIVQSLWRYRLVVAAATVLAAITGYVLAGMAPTSYEADAILILRDPGSSAVTGHISQSADLQPYLAKQADIMVSSLVLQDALRTLGSNQPVREAKAFVQAAPSKDLASVVVRATAPDPAGAAALANAVAGAYTQVTVQRAADEEARAVASIEKVRTRLQAELDALPAASGGRSTLRQQTLQGQVNDLQQREEDVITQSAVYASGVDLFEPAERPLSPSQPRPKLGAMLGGLLGLLAAGTWAWWAAARNRRAEHGEDPAAILGAPLLGEVPRFPDRLIGEPRSSHGIGSWSLRLRGRAPRTPQAKGTAAPSPSPPALDPAVAEAYHFIVASLEHELRRTGSSSVVVTSAAPGDGKTSTVMNLAFAARQERRRVVVIDADHRTRRLSELSGLTERSSARRRERDGVVPVAPVTPVGAGRSEEPFDAQEYLDRLALTRDGLVLPLPQARTGTGGGHPSRFFRTPAFRKVLLSVEEQADLVLIDAPALLAVSDAIAIAAQAGGIVVVVDRGVPLRQLRALRERLAFISTPLIGYVFNRSPASPGAYAAHYQPAGGSATGTVQPIQTAREAKPGHEH